MKTYTEAQLNEVLRKHKHWILEDCDGWQNMRADLSGASLSGANLFRADLTGANLFRADLTEADLSGANLSRANLSRANLSGADLTGANLFRADLTEADLTGANLFRANLSRANLSGADLTGANLSEADLSGANLSRANLFRADLTGASLSGAGSIPMACPDTGSFTAWKKAGGKIVKLLVTADARRSSATGRKCRCDKAIVAAIENLDGTDSGLSSVASNYDSKFVYEINELVAVPDFCEDRFLECAAGIHFFINRQEAVEYNG